MSRGLKVFFTAWSVYLFFIYIYPQSISGQMVDLGMSLVDNANTYLRYSAGFKDVSFFRGNFLSGHFPGAAVPAAALYALAKPFVQGLSGADSFLVMNALSCVFIASVMGGVTASLVYRFARRTDLGGRAAVLTAFILAFGTISFGYSLALYKVTQVSLCMFSAFYLIFRETDNGRNGPFAYFAAGVLTGAGVATHPVYAIIGAVIVLYAVSKAGVGRGLLCLTGAVLPLLLLAFYLKISFGSYIADPYAFRADAVEYPYELTYPRLSNFFYLLFGLKEGFFIYMPVLLFAFPGVVRAWKGGVYRKEAAAVMLMLLAVTLFFSGYVFKSDPGRVVSAHDAGIPSRFLEPLCPFLAVIAGFGFSRARKRVFCSLSAVSVFFSYLAAQAGFLPGKGGTQLVYSVKVFLSSFGVPVLFSETLPGVLGIGTFHTYLAEARNTLGELLAPGNGELLLRLLTNQMIFVFLFASMFAGAVYLLRLMWRTGR
ncbi:MAG: hypothetical protein GF408_05750 [Candidatus Omnitrophica bacterium]|nr:hypothetical protein [Candidatus Omnitrophota bacterium]